MEPDCVATSCQRPCCFTSVAKKRTLALNDVPSGLLPCAEIKPEAMAASPQFRA